MATFYVSPTGSDSASGTSATSAFKTLAKAQAAERASAGADTIVVGGGTYTLSAPLALTSADSGTTWVEASGQNAILDGGNKKASLITVSGASGITIQGLTFQNTAAGNDNDAAPGAISINGGSTINVLANTFNNTAKGVVAEDGATKVTVDGNSFTNIANAAIDFNFGSFNNTASNNTMSHIGYVFSEGAAIQLYESTGNLVTHNLIQDTPRHGIEEQNWDPSNKSGGNTIEYNVIKHVMQTTTDGGAIYAYSGLDQTAPLGDTIRYNYISDTGPSLAWGIYMDDYTNNAKIYGNFVQGTQAGGVMLHGGSNNEVYNNVLIDNRQYGLQVMAIDKPVTGNNIHNNLIAMASGSTGPIVAMDPMTPSSFHDNVYVSQNGTKVGVGYDGGTLAQWQAQGGDKGTDVVTSPGFTNPAAGDYSFAPGAFALTQGISQLPFASMGPGSGSTTPPTQPPTTPPTTPPVTVDTLVLQLSGDAYRGDPQFIVKVDGKQLGSATPVTADHDDQQKQSFTFTNDWADGTHSVEIDFTNDAVGRGGDRNLWVENVTYNGKSYGPSKAVELAHNTDKFVVTVGQ